MASGRKNKKDFGEAYRAVLTTTYTESGNVYTEYQGPYQTQAAAKGRVTAHEKNRWSQKAVLTGHVEKAAGPWEKVA